jgi:transaldolase
VISRIRQIAALGQSTWLDFLSRELLESGELESLVNEGVLGVTSNPTIFHKAIAGSRIYDAEIRRLGAAGLTAEQICEALVIQDVRAAADVLRPVYNETHGRDGFVSVEINPHLANDTEATIAEARRLFAAIGRPNVMIKVPATEAGLPAITALIGEGVNVNVTLIFAISVYERVMQAYLEGLRLLSKTGRPLGLVSSVASFFVSRIDTLTDKVLQHRVEHGGEDHLVPLLGQAAVASAKIAYQRFKAVFTADGFAEFRQVGARPQRPLWASTSTKNPAYPDTKYVDPLIGMYTVTTLPRETLNAVRDHGIVAQTIEDDLPHAYAVMRELAGVKVDMDWITACLLEEGLRLFAESYDQLLKDIEARRAALAGAAAGRI